jgi:choline dehydrogenase-like flavoprotein
VVDLHDFIVVGSGAGGATVAKELCVAGKKVLLLEGGKSVEPRKAADAYSVVKGDVEIWYASCLGGTTMVSMGNAVRSGLYPELKDYYARAESEMGVVPVPEGRMGKGTRLLREAHKGWHVMPKAIDFSICKGCGQCPNGCPTTARWSSLRYVSEARKSGCDILTGCMVKSVIIESGRAAGVQLDDGRSFRGGVVVLSAGAIETPRILHRSGVKGAGEGLFADTFITVGGLKRGIGMNAELGMALYAKRDGYLLSPHYSSFLVQRLRQKGIKSKPSDILGIMVKIEDEPTGKVGQDGVTKGITRRDALLLEAGRREAIDILMKAGVEERTIVSTHPRGAHPGGTCNSLIKSWGDQTLGVESLYISDASILAGPFGLPPLLTIVAGSKFLASAILGTP